jgi:hypothetical protein
MPIKAEHLYQCGHVVKTKAPDMITAMAWGRRQLQVPCPVCGNADHLPEELRPKKEETEHA